MGFAITAMAFPLMLYAQLVRGLCPTRSALLLVPMAVMSIVLAPFVGRLTDRVHPRSITCVGFSSIIGLAGLAVPGDDARLAHLAAAARRWCCSASATPACGPRSAPPRPATCRSQLAGAGAGVYNATRQVGAVLGSAAIAVLMDSRIAAQGLSFQPSESRRRRPCRPASGRLQPGDGRLDAAASPCCSAGRRCCSSSSPATGPGRRPDRPRAHSAQPRPTGASPYERPSHATRSRPAAEAGRRAGPGPRAVSR